MECVSKPLCCCHFNQCVGAAVLSHFCPLSNHFLIGNCRPCVARTMSCVCVGFVGVCCVVSSDGVWGVDDAVCLAVHSQKRQHSTRPCLHVMVCTNASCCMACSECERVFWCGGCREKREEAKTQSNKNKKDFSQNHFFPFPFFLPLFLPLFSPCLPLFHHHSLLIHTHTCFSCFTYRCIHGEPKTPMTQHLILFIVFSSCPNSLFLFFSFS